MVSEPVAIHLTKAEALILFDMLVDFRDESSVQVKDQADRVALWNLCCLLEKSLVEVFAPDYKELLVRAREELAR